MEHRIICIILRAIEGSLVLVAAILFLMANRDATGDDEGGRTYAKTVGTSSFFWLSGLLFVLYIIDKPPDRLVNLLMCIVCACYSLAGGAILIAEYADADKVGSGTDEWVASGVFALANAILFIVDGALIYCKS